MARSGGTSGSPPALRSAAAGMSVATGRMVEAGPARARRNDRSTADRALPGYPSHLRRGTTPNGRQAVSCRWRISSRPTGWVRRPRGAGTGPGCGCPEAGVAAPVRPGRGTPGLGTTGATLMALSPDCSPACCHPLTWLGRRVLLCTVGQEAVMARSGGTSGSPPAARSAYLCRRSSAANSSTATRNCGSCCHKSRAARTRSDAGTLSSTRA